MLHFGQLLQIGAVEFGHCVGGVGDNGTDADAGVEGNQIFAHIADAGAVAFLVAFFQAVPVCQLLPDGNVGGGALRLEALHFQPPLLVVFVGSPGVGLHHFPHDLLKDQLSAEVFHIQMDVQLGIHRQVGGGEPLLAGQAAHGQHKAQRPGIMAIFGNPQQGGQQRV